MKLLKIPGTPLTELRALFRSQPAFRQVYLSDLIDQLGDGGLLIAFPMLILEHTHDLTLTGLAYSGEVLAYGLMSPLAGYLADRLEQKRLMLAANAARALLLVGLLLALAAGLPTALFLGLSLLLGAANAFFVPARSAFLRRILEGETLDRVIALEGTTSFLVRLVSPPLMGFLLAFFPARLGVALDVAAYTLSMLLLMPSWVRGHLVVEAHEGGEDWREGWRLVLGLPEVRSLVVLDVALSAVGMAAFSLTVALLAESLHLPPQANGWLLATTGLAGAIGTQLGDKLGARRWLWPVLVGAIALTYLLVPFATSLHMLMAMWTMRGLAIGVLGVQFNQRFTALVPAAVMGRAQAAWGLVVCIAAAAGSATTPLLLRTLGAAGSYTLFGVLLTLVALGAAAASVAAPRRVLVEAS